jgi:outer membrane murein-binding lipoprotein Lpp
MNAKKIITSNKTILAAALLTLGLTGCASTQSINYTPQANVSSLNFA